MTKITTPISFIFEISKSLNLKIFIDYKRNLELESRINRLGKPFSEKPDKKEKKTQEIKLLHGKKKPQLRKRIFVQTPFSHSNLKLKMGVEKKTPQNGSRLRSSPFLV